MYQKLRKNFYYALVIFGLFCLSRLSDPSYTEIWVEGGPRVAARTVVILVTLCVLLLAILGLGYSVASDKCSNCKEMKFSTWVAVFGSGFSLLVILGSFVSLIPNKGLVFLALVIYLFAFVGLKFMVQWARVRSPGVLGKLANTGKIDLVLSGLISSLFLIVVFHSLVLETYSDVVQIYLPFFEYFESSGSSQAVLEKPAFSSFIQLRGLGSHLSATSIGGWTTAQTGSLLALFLILIVVCWSVSDYTKRIFAAEISITSWTLPSGALLAVLYFYSSASIYSKPHLVSFSLLIALTAFLPMTVDGSYSEGRLFRRSSVFLASATCIVFPLNFVAVILIVFVNTLNSWISQKTLMFGQAVQVFSWALFSTVTVSIINLYFVGVFGTEPIFRAVRIDETFNQFSSESIWRALYSSQNIDSFRQLFSEPFVGKNLFSGKPFNSMVGLFNQNGYLLFVICLFGALTLSWFRFRASIVALCGGAIIVFSAGRRLNWNLDDALRKFVLLLGFVGLLSLICAFVTLELSHSKMPNLIKSFFSFSPFNNITFTLLLLALTNRVIKQPSFNRLMDQGNLVVALLPCSVVFFLLKLRSSLSSLDVRKEINVNGFKSWSRIKPSSRILIVFGSVVVALTITKLVFVPTKRFFLMAFVFVPMVLSLVLFSIRNTYLIQNRSLNKCLKTYATTWIVAQIIFATVWTFPSYEPSTNSSVVKLGKQVALDFQKLTGFTGHMSDRSSVIGFHTKEDIRRCLELASIIPSGAKIFPINGLQEFAVCQGTPGLNRGQLIHHYDSVLAPLFDEIMRSDVQQTLAIFQKKNIRYLVMLEGDCNKFLISQNVAFDENSVKNFQVFRKGSDFVVFDISVLRQAIQPVFSDILPEYLVEFSRACATKDTQ